LKSVYIVGVGMTKVGKHTQVSLRDLASQAVLKAIDDAGGERPDALVVGNMLSSLVEQENLAALIADHSGLRGISGFKTESACSSGGSALLAGYSLVASGLFNKVLVVGVEKLHERPTPDTTRGLSYAADADYELIYGISFAGLNALIMRYYMSKYGVTREEMAWWPVMMHENGFYNPFAQLRKKITVEEVINSPVIADPIRLYDSCPLSDGAAAVMLTSDKFKDLNDTHVKISGIGSAIDSPDLSSRFRLDRLYASRLSAERAFKMAKKEARDVDIAEIHDAYSIIAAITMEEIGFSEEGNAPKQWAEGRFRNGDKPVLNPSGGLKSRGHPVGATGVYQAAEITMQLRGDFPGLQVGGEVGLSQNVGGVGSNVITIIYTR